LRLSVYVNFLGEKVNSMQQQKKKSDTSKTIALEIDVEEIKYIFMPHYKEFRAR
jgi:hypothetical protein